MREQTADLWTMPADWRCVTTNGMTKRDGTAVMGKGCALQAAERYPDVPRLLAACLKTGGNHVHLLRTLPDGSTLLSFPTKHDWHDRADIELIARSARELVRLANTMPAIQLIVLPRLGSGAGRLTWSAVRAVVAPLLDDRFVVVTYPPAEGRIPSGAPNAKFFV